MGKTRTPVEIADRKAHSLQVHNGSDVEIYYLKSEKNLSNLNLFFHEMLKYPDSRMAIHVVLSTTLMHILSLKVDGLPLSDCIRVYYGDQAMHVIEVLLTYYTN